MRYGISPSLSYLILSYLILSYLIFLNKSMWEQPLLVPQMMTKRQHKWRSRCLRQHIGEDSSASTATNHQLFPPLFPHQQLGTTKTVFTNTKYPILQVKLKYYYFLNRHPFYPQWSVLSYDPYFSSSFLHSSTLPLTPIPFPTTPCPASYYPFVSLPLLNYLSSITNLFCRRLWGNIRTPKIYYSGGRTACFSLQIFKRQTSNLFDY